MENSEKYTHCSRCGAAILEKCAIEEDGQIFCGDCVVSKTTRAVSQAEEVCKQKRKEEYEHARRETIRKQRDRTVMVLIVCLCLFAAVQVFNYYNRPEPVQSVVADIETDLDTAEALLHLGIHKYRAEHDGKLPDSLVQLLPDYAPGKLSDVLNLFSYEKTEDKTYSLQIVTGDALEERKP